MIGRPCSGNDSDLKWDDTTTKAEPAPETTPKIETPKSSTKITKKPKKG
jgi:hypothetical protein